MPSFLLFLSLTVLLQFRTTSTTHKVLAFSPKAWSRSNSVLVTSAAQHGSSPSPRLRISVEASKTSEADVVQTSPVTAYRTTTAARVTIPELCAAIENNVRGRSDPIPSIERLESVESLEEPNRAPQNFGQWEVWWTNCPPPSNGQLGPFFQGTVSQVIPYNDPGHQYQNLLRVPPNDWLSATLDGVWEEWDGKYLTSEDMSDQDTKAVATDHGANSWKVTFLTLRIDLKLWERTFSILKQTFPANTSRVWRTTYLDDEVRVVRAGKTGKRSDEVIFYCRRTAPPAGWIPN
jgi:hypothetical protein